MIKLLSYRKYYLSMWLLALSILFNGLTFSGDIDNLPPQTEESTQTEQLFSGNDGSEKNISYRNASNFSQTQKILSHCIKEQKYALLLYNNLQTKQYKTTLKQSLSFDTVKLFTQSFTHPKNSKEDPIPSQLG